MGSVLFRASLRTQSGKTDSGDYDVVKTWGVESRGTSGTLYVDTGRDDISDNVEGTSPGSESLCVPAHFPDTTGGPSETRDPPK